MDPGWPPVAWGRGCSLIGNSDLILPEGEGQRWGIGERTPQTTHALKARWVLAKWGKVSLTLDIRCPDLFSARP
eukprot:9061883-Pyramimonas_sp.AAC.1